MMEAIILAGGMGTRLQAVVADVPKPMAPVNDKPFLNYLLQWIARYPVKKIILSVGYKNESIREYFKDSFGRIPVEYATEVKPLGTGGAVINALEKTGSNYILIMNGDTWFPINLNKLYSVHTDKKHVFTIALKRMRKFSRYGSVECTGNTITRFNERKYCEEGFINGGIYLVNKDFFKTRQFPEVFSLEKDTLVREAGTSVLKGMVFNDPFIDIGVPEDYRRAGSVIKI
jgi:D-glycero-alpha-D-manno-heptose 1-phosphate guanylyltransferase